MNNRNHLTDVIKRGNKEKPQKKLFEWLERKAL
jgi:hypothetical protein